MKLVYCSANIYLLVYISHFFPIISRRHLKHTADKCTRAREFKKPFIFCFITLRYIQAKINEQFKFQSLISLWSSKNCIVCRCPSGFGPSVQIRQWIWTPRSKFVSRYGPPGPNPLADMDPLRGFGPPYRTE